MRFVETDSIDKYRYYNEPNNGNFIANCVMAGAFFLTFSSSALKAFAAPKPKPVTEWCYNQIADFKSMEIVPINAPVVDMVRLPLYVKIDSLGLLKDNWDGCGSKFPNYEAIKNTRHLIEVLDKDNLKYLAADSIYPSSYGSIILDFEAKRGLVSVEIGDNSMGFFTDFINGENYAAEGINTDFVSCPRSLELCLS